MKKTTTDISAGRDQILCIPSEKIHYTSRNTPQSLPRKSQLTDISSNKKIVHASSPFRIFFFSCLVIIPFLLVGIGITNAIALKKNLSGIALQTKIAFDEAVQSLTNEQYARSAEAFLQVSHLIEQMRTQIEPLYMHTKFIHHEDPALLKLLASGEEFSAAGLRLAALAPQLRELPFAITRKEDVLPILATVKHEMTILSELLQNVQHDIETIDSPLLPADIANNIDSLRALIPEGQQAITLVQSMASAGEILLGKEYPQTIAVFFQNSNELRATGGFMGSMAMIDTNNGKGELDFKDIYSFAWQNSTEFPPPRGFERLASKLTLQDANANFDFPTSAEKIRMMLEYSAAPTAETIVTITDELLSELLIATGPIPIPNTDEKITAENAAFLLTFFVESKLSGEHSPKDILKDILPQLTVRLTEVPPAQLMQIAKRAIREKWILAHSTNPIVQEFFVRLGIDGALKTSATADYLAVVSANVGGNKSDAFVREALTIDTAVDLVGNAIDTLQIIREHTWDDAAATEFERLLTKYGSEFVAPSLLKNILGAGDNHTFTEVFVPLGAELLSVRGIPREAIKSRTEKDKTVFAFRFPAVSARSSETVTLQYRLPQQVTANGDFDLYFQSQPGRHDVFVKRTVVAEAGLRVDIGEVAGKALSGDAIFHSRLSR